VVCKVNSRKGRSVEVVNIKTRKGRRVELVDIETRMGRSRGVGGLLDIMTRRAIERGVLELDHEEKAGRYAQGYTIDKYHDARPPEHRNRGRYFLMRGCT
jgi:hypothetical protein